MSDSRTVRVSVIVPTRNRAHLLSRLVAALESQTLPPDQFEVLVADDGSDDGTIDALGRLSSSSPLRLRAVRGARREGQAVARNRACREAQGAMLAFTDDDCEPQPGWLEAGLAALEGSGEPRVVVAVGRTIPRPTDADRLLRPFSRSVEVGEVRFFETCNAFYRRQDVEAVGGFDEAFTGHGGEDTDLALRVLAHTAGRATFAAAALVHHDVRPPSWASRLRETLTWTGVPLLVKRHPRARGQLLHRGLFWRPSHPATLAALTGIVLALRRPAALALVTPWLWRRTVRDPVCPGPRRRWLALPGAFVLDVVEVGVMVRASARHRTLVL